MSRAPAVSIITATYNRAYVLRHAVESVLASDFSDWELIVVGDCCTDETEAVMAPYLADPRIRFINLPENSGQQSGPNNAGLAVARGEYVLFLNHDDLYFPDHISGSIAFLEATGADVAWSPVLLVGACGEGVGPPDFALDRLSLGGTPTDGRYDPGLFIIASSWATRRSAFDRAGPWAPAEATRLLPSQDWLFRAHRAGLALAYHPHVSVLCIHAGVRKNTYLSRRSLAHERAVPWVKAGDATRAALIEIAAQQAAGALEAQRLIIERLSDRSPAATARRWTTAAMARLGWHPTAVARGLAGKGKGEVIADVRRLTAQADALAPGEEHRAGGPAFERYLGYGWGPSEPGGRWTVESEAELLFAVDCDGPGVLELTGHPLRLPGEVAFSVDGGAPVRHRYNGHDTVRLDFGAAQNHRLAIVVADPTSPRLLSGEADERILGFRLVSVRIADPSA